MNYSWELIKIFLYLALIIGIIILVARIFKKGYFHHNKGKHMQIIEQIYLGQKNLLSLVKIKDKVILFSVGSEDIKKITEWPEEEFADIEIKETPDFKKQLKKYLNGSWRDHND